MNKSLSKNLNQCSVLSNNNPIIDLIVPNELAGERLDVALAKLLPQYSRSRLASWIKKGAVTVNRSPSIAKHKLIGTEQIKIICDATPEETSFRPQIIHLNIVYEDTHLLVLNKPPDLVVHPAAGNWSHTLLNGLLHYHQELHHLPRAGIVHRLDKNTSGLMVVAKTLETQTDLVKQLQARTIKRLYRAITLGIIPYDGSIHSQIGRHPYTRTKMAVLSTGGKEAITHIRVLKRFKQHSYIECALETGRTHQIRVHMQHAGYPLVGDPIYGGTLRLTNNEQLNSVLRTIDRQMLHAYQLHFIHPIKKEKLSFQADLPLDMRHLLDLLYKEEHSKSQDY